MHTYSTPEYLVVMFVAQQAFLNDKTCIYVIIF